MHSNHSQKTQFDSFAHPWAKWNLIFAFVSLFYFGMADNIRGPLFPEVIREFGLTSFGATWFFALGSIMMVFSGMLTPWFLKKWGYLQVFRIAVLLLAVSQFVYATSSQFPGMLAGTVLIGTSIGVLGVIQNILVLVGSPPNLLSRGMNGLHASYGAASLAAPLIVALLAILHPNYRLGFWVTGLIGVLLVLSTLRIPGFVEPQARAETREVSQAQWLTPEIFFVAFLISSYVMSEILFSTRIAQFSRLDQGSTLQESSLWTSLFFVGLFLGRFLFSLIQLKWSLRKQLAVTFVASTAFSLFGIFVSPWAWLATGLAMGPCYPNVMSLLRDLFPHQIERATTVVIVLEGVFIVAMHLSAGSLTDLVGVRWAMGIGPLFLFLAVSMLVLHPLIWPRPGANEVLSHG